MPALEITGRRKPASCADHIPCCELGAVAVKITEHAHFRIDHEPCTVAICRKNSDPDLDRFSSLHSLDWLDPGLHRLQCHVHGWSLKGKDEISVQMFGKLFNVP